MAGRSTAFLLPATTVAFILLLVLGFVAADPRPLNEAAGGFARTPGRALATSDVECPSEFSDCLADASCLACLEEYNTQSAECGDEYEVGGEIPCEDAQEFVCCTLAEEDANCENDSTFSTYLECALDELNPQCGGSVVDISDCSGASGLAFPWGAFSVFNLTAVAGLFIAAFGFVV